MIEAAAWTLVHFLWQGTLVWLLVSVQLRFLSQARTRYAVACLAMLLMLALPLATFMMLAAGGHSGETEAGGFFSSSTAFVRVATRDRLRDGVDAATGRVVGKRGWLVLIKERGRPGTGVCLATQGSYCIAPRVSSGSASSCRPA